jgi:hypothetical protein
MRSAGPAAVAAFWAVWFLFVVTPGADWVYAISAGLRNRTVLPRWVGCWSGTWRPRLWWRPESPHALQAFTIYFEGRIPTS